MTCSTCNDYLIQIRKASINYDDTLYWSIMDLYIAHLRHAHQPATPSREAVRQAFGRFGR